MAIPRPDSGILKRVYASIFNSGGYLSLDVPDRVLERLYTYGSLRNTDDGIRFEMKNRLQDARFAGVDRVVVDGERIDPERVHVETADGEQFRLDQVTADDPIPFSVGRTVYVTVEELTLPTGDHEMEVAF